MKLRDNRRTTEGLFAIGGVLLVLLPALALVFFGKMQAVKSKETILINDATPTQFASILGIEPEIAKRVADYRTVKSGFEGTDALLELPLFTPAERDAILSECRHDPKLESSAFRSDARQLSKDFKLGVPLMRRFAAFRDSLLSHSNSTGISGDMGQTAVPGSESPASQLQKKHPLKSLLVSATLLDATLTRPLLKTFIVRTPATVSTHFLIGAGILALTMVLLPGFLRGKEGGGDPWLIPATILLCGLGVAILFSVKDPLRDRAVYEHHLWGMIPAFFALVVGAKLRASARARIPRYLYLWVIVSVLLAGALFVFGSGPEGVKLNLFHFQPVEAIKLFSCFSLRDTSQTGRI